jgi:hypothetical protein
MKNSLGSLALGLVAAFALPAQAMYLNPQGTGQVLLFPYYTVNSNQSTLLTLVNTTNAAKMLQIKFREGYNSRAVLDFHVFVGPNDSWTATVFALQPRDGASIMTRDESCTAPDKIGWAAPFPGGGYQQPFLPFAYTGDNVDGAPTAITRTREGHVDIVELAELAGPLADAVTNRHPPNCTPLQAIDPGSPHLRPPGGGVYGSFAIIDVAEGTLFGGNAAAIDDFSRITLVTDTASLIEWLGAGNSRPGEVDAQIPVDGGYTTLTYANVGAPQYGGPNAVSALITADSVFGAMSREASVGSHTEWVLTSPTKFFYTDNQRLGVPLGEPGAVAPFEQTFGEDGIGASCVRYAPGGFDREGRPVLFMPDASPRGELPQHALCYATNVVHFSNLPADGATPMLGSRLGSKVWNPTPATETANVRLQLGVHPGSTERNILPAGVRGPALRGLPVIGFEAVRYINGNVSPGVLANYTMATPLRADVACVDAAGAQIECPSQ